jgi:hypothetical protein
VVQPAPQLSYYSADYFEARERFRHAASDAGAALHALEVVPACDSHDSLTMDVALVGDPLAKRTLMVSSGVHGVETPLGAAVQLALLEQWKRHAGDGYSIALLHAVNPFGFAMRRRFNEDNVDLNRNFLLADDEYVGAPRLANAFRQVLGPPTRPFRIATSTLRMGYLAARHGKRSFWETLPVGQYEHADWLFYGGDQLARSGELLRDLLPSLLGRSQEVVHIDFHTGLGRWANLELLLSERESTEGARWWRQHFAPHPVVESNQVSRYTVRGSFGPWIAELLPGANYHYAAAEFGTYKPLQVVRSLADENRWTRAVQNLPKTHWSRRRLAEAFAPRDSRWRLKCLATGIEVVERAASRLAD